MSVLKGPGDREVGEGDDFKAGPSSNPNMKLLEEPWERRDRQPGP